MSDRLEGPEYEQSVANAKAYNARAREQAQKEMGALLDEHGQIILPGRAA
jgi:hypothetical protein